MRTLEYTFSVGVVVSSAAFCLSGCVKKTKTTKFLHHWLLQHDFIVVVHVRVLSALWARKAALRGWSSASQSSPPLTLMAKAVLDCRSCRESAHPDHGL